MQRNDMVWKSAEVSKHFLEGVRGSIPLADEQIDVMLRLIHAARPGLTNFMDLGCGDGVLGKAILEHYPRGHGLFVDISEPMIEAARGNLASHSQNLTFLVEDYGVREWVEAVQPYAPFDAIVSGFSIHHQPDTRKREVYQEVYNLLKAGGVFLNLEHVASPSDWLENRSDDLLIDSLIAYNEANGIDQSPEETARKFRQRPDKIANILAPTELQCDWLREIGFLHVDCYIKIFELALFGGVCPDE